MPCWKIKTRVGIALAAFTIDASWREVQQIINNNNCNNRAAAAAAVMNKFLYLQLRRLPGSRTKQSQWSYKSVSYEKMNDWLSSSLLQKKVR